MEGFPLPVLQQIGKIWRKMQNYVAYVTWAKLECCNNLQTKCNEIKVWIPPGDIWLDLGINPTSWISLKVHIIFWFIYIRTLYKGWPGLSNQCNMFNIQSGYKIFKFHKVLKDILAFSETLLHKALRHPHFELRNTLQFFPNPNLIFCELKPHANF